MFSIGKVVERIGGEFVGGVDPSIQVTSLSFSTDTVSDGSLFVAIVGSSVDAHNFLDQVFENGAACVVVSDRKALNGRPGIVVSDTRKALSALSSFFNGEPAEDLNLVGITGTNGKTTTQWMIYSLLRAVGKPTLRIGTLGFEAPGLSDNSSLTTPDPYKLHTLLKSGYDAGAKYGVMEISSHALDQSRVDDAIPEIGIFTNLTRDHIDYHGSMEEYYLAKQRLFDLLKEKDGKGIINIDDPYGGRLVEYCNSIGLKVITYGESEGADIAITRFRQSIDGSQFGLTYLGKEYKISIPFIGRYNSHNFAAAFGGAVGLGIDPVEVERVCTDLPSVPGRLELLSGDDIGVFVDYAHTPDAVENASRALRPLAEKRLWILFGCGGDRDRGKRPEMGAAAARYGDKIVVTSDNPRTEDPDRIISDILSKGLDPDIVEIDRRLAIREVISKAEPGDLVLIAGKGHEDYQIIGTEKSYFSDQDEVREALAARGPSTRANTSRKSC